MDKVRESQQLVCSHIRIGRNPTIPHDSKRRDRTNVTSIFMFLKRFDIPSRYVIYVASDSQKVRESVAGNFTSSFTVDLPIVHFHAALLKQYILSKCDILILTRSGFGKMAVHMSEKFQELYIFDSSNQTVIKRPKISEQMLGMHGRFSPLFHKGNNFRDFPFAFQHAKALLKVEYSKRKNLLPFLSFSFQKGDKTVLAELLL